MIAPIVLARGLAVHAERQARATIDRAYWAYTRTARGKPPVLVVPEAYHALGRAQEMIRALAEPVAPVLGYVYYTRDEGGSHRYAMPTLDGWMGADYDVVDVDRVERRATVEEEQAFNESLLAYAGRKVA